MVNCFNTLLVCKIASYGHLVIQLVANCMGGYPPFPCMTPTFMCGICPRLTHGICFLPFNCFLMIFSEYVFVPWLCQSMKYYLLELAITRIHLVSISLLD